MKADQILDIKVRIKMKIWKIEINNIYVFKKIYIFQSFIIFLEEQGIKI